MAEDEYIISSEVPASATRDARHAATTNVSKRAKKSPSVRVSSGTVTASKAAGSFAKLVIIISAIWAYAAVRRYGIPDVSGELAEKLAMTNEEAADIARPIGRLAMSNSTAAKVISPIVENDDLIDALFAIFEWQKRMNETLSQYRPHQIQDNQRQVRTDESALTHEVSPDVGGGYDPLDGGYDANRDARVV